MTVRTSSLPQTAPPMPMEISTTEFIRRHITLIGCPKLDEVELYGKADGDHCRGNDIKQRDGGADGGSLLRRD